MFVGKNKEDGKVKGREGISMLLMLLEDFGARGELFGELQNKSEKIKAKKKNKKLNYRDRVMNSDQYTRVFDGRWFICERCWGG
jgi:hypothetical protein